MLRWLATLSYDSIATSQANQFLTDPVLVGTNEDDVPQPAKDPKAAVFQVCYPILFNKKSQNLRIKLCVEVETVNILSLRTTVENHIYR